jgi:hypothetical protein
MPAAKWVWTPECIAGERSQMKFTTSTLVEQTGEVNYRNAAGIGKST